MAFISEEHTMEYICGLVAKSRAAQKQFEHNYKDQHSIDEVVRQVIVAVKDHGLEIAQDAVKETGMGNAQGKLNKMLMGAMSQWVNMRGKQSVGYADCPGEPGAKFMFKPMGVIGAVMPSTNPLVTIVANAMMNFKNRNSIIIAPHPASAHISEKVVAAIRKGLAEIGAPEDIILTISAEESCVEATKALLSQCDANIGTGGRGMVKAVYSSGKPAFGVGQGNCQLIVDTDIADEEYPKMVAMSVANRTFDNGVPCAGEQTFHIPADKEEFMIEQMKAAKAFVVTDEETTAKLRELIFPDGKPVINRKVVGRVPYEVGKMAGVDVPEGTSVLYVKNQAWGDMDLLCREILLPIIRYTTYETFEEGVDHALANLYEEGAGHSSALWSHNQDHIDYAADLIPVGRFHINQPTGGAGNGLDASVTIGCGTWGGNSISEFLQWYHLYNKTKVTTVVPNLRPRLSLEKELEIWDDLGKTID